MSSTLKEGWFQGGEEEQVKKAFLGKTKRVYANEWTPKGPGER